MSEHAWAEENVAAYAVGGLSAREAERLEAHARDCPACSAAIDAARALDRDLSDLFAPARPGPELEDRAVGRLRVSGASPVGGVTSVPPVLRKALTAVAVLLMLGVCGALVQPEGTFRRRSEKETFGFVGSSIKVTDNSGSTPAPATAQELTNEDSGLQSRLEAARPEIERVEKNLRELDVVRGRTDQSRGFFDLTGQVAPNNDTTALIIPGLTTGETGPMFDPLAKPDRKLLTTYSNAFKPGEHKFLVTVNGTSGTAGYGTTVTPTGVSVPPPKPAGEQKEPAKNPDPKSQPKPPEFDPQPVRRVVIRSGDIEFEVPSFDAASAAVTKLVGNIKGGFIATINSDKLPNGKVKGSITVRVPPEHLDGLVLDLRKEIGANGELKGVKLTSQDVTKQYTDLESRLRGARTMETRLLQMIKEGKGDIKQILEAERELGVWRTKIEEYEGELRYYSNLAALSTLTITLTEKEIRAAAGLTESERVQTGVEVEDVDKAYQELLKAITDAKGRILKSEVKQLTAGQYNAALHFEVAPEASGPMRDRIRQLGRVARLEIDRVTQTEGGTLPTDAKTKRGDTVFLVQLYNLANVAPRETATVQVAATDVPTAYQNFRDAIAKAAGRVLNAQLNEQDKTNVSAVLDFEVRRAEEGTIRAALDAAGEVLARQVVRAPESENVTDAKVLYKVAVVAANRLKPRQIHTLSVEVADVEGTAAVFAAAVADAKGRQVDANTSRDRSGKATAKLVFEVPLSAAAGLVERFKGAGVVRLNQSSRDPQATEGRFATARIDVTLTSPEDIVAEGEGLWDQVRRGLTYSATVLLKSVTWVVFGLCVVLPWAVIGLVAYRLVRRWFYPAPVPATVAAASPPAGPPATA